MVPKLTFITEVLLAVFGVACCNQYTATVDNLPIVEVTKWQKYWNWNTSDYGWDNPVEVTYVNNIAVGRNVTVSTILAGPDQHYKIVCYGVSYETKLDIDLPPTRKTFLKRYRFAVGELFNNISKYHTDTKLRFFTEEGKNGTIVCKSVEHPEVNVTINILSSGKSSIWSMGSHNQSTESNSADQNEIDLNGTATFEISNNHGGVYCRDKNKLSTTKSLKMILCFSPYHCDLFKSCFNQNQSCSSANIQEGIPCETEDCLIIYEGYSVGMGQCKSGQDTETSLTFTGLDRRRYKVSDDIPTKALIEMEDVEPVLYTHERHFFFCSAISFLFVDDIEFSLKYKNGTQSFVPKDLVTPATSLDLDSRLARGLVRKGIYLNVTEEMTEIVCMAPWYNSNSNWLTTSKKFKAIDIKKPSINTPSNSSEKEGNTFNFYLGDTGRILDCSASGQPPPTFKWFRILSNQSLEPEEVDNRNGFTAIKAEGESILKFPLITSDLDGEYRCVASNIYGNDTWDLKVRVKSR